MSKHLTGIIALLEDFTEEQLFELEYALKKLQNHPPSQPVSHTISKKRFVFGTQLPYFNALVRERFTYALGRSDGAVFNILLHSRHWGKLGTDITDVWNEWENCSLTEDAQLMAVYRSFGCVCCFPPRG